MTGLYLGYQKLRKIQARRLTVLATEYLKQRKPQEAQMSLQTALRLSPSDPAALRLQAQLMQSQGEALQSLASYLRLAQTGKMTLTDLYAFAVAAERQGDGKLADRLANVASKGNALLGHLIRADLLKMRKQPEAAIEELRKALAESTKDQKNSADMARMELVKLLVARLPSDSPAQSEKKRLEALSLLQELGTRESEPGATSLVSALRSGIIPPAELSIWIQRLRTHPKVTPEQLLLADLAMIQSDPTQKDVVIASMLKRLQAAKPEQRLAAAQQLLMMKESASAASLITEKDALGGAPAFTLWLQTLKMTGRHEEAIEALSKSSTPLPRHLQDLFLADELKAVHEDARSKAVYQKAFSDYVLNGTKDPEKLETLIVLNKVGEQDLFDQGVRKVLADPDKGEAMLYEIVLGINKQHDSEKILRILELASKASPQLAENIGFKNFRDYERLLMNQSVDANALTKRVEANPNEFSFRVTEALALMKAGKKARALEVMESIEADVDPSKLPPSQMAVLVSAMASNGDRQKASQLLGFCRMDLLTMQENAMIKEAFSETNPSGSVTPPSPKP